MKLLFLLYYYIFHYSLLLFTGAPNPHGINQDLPTPPTNNNNNNSGIRIIDGNILGSPKKLNPSKGSKDDQSSLLSVTHIFIFMIFYFIIILFPLFTLYIFISHS
jgi:hypothetical protein